MIGGLLGSSFDDPKTMGLLQLAASLSSARRPMQGLTQGLLSYQQAIAQGRQQQALEEERALRKQMAELQLQQAQQAQQRQAGIDQAYRGAIRTPEQMAMAAHGGPTNAAAQAAPGMASGIDQNALLRGLMQADPQSAFQMLQPKPADRKVVGDALLEIGPGGVKELYRAPAKPEALPSAVREYQFAQQQGYKGTFQQFQLEQKRAGATNLSVNTGDRIPAGLVKQQDEIIDRITTARSTDADLASVEGMLATGKLQFGPIRNLMNEGRNIAGASTEESRAYGSFKSTLEKLRNDSLRLNAGVQTDGDAQRAWNELFQNINDTEFVRQRLGEIRKINQRAAELQTYRLGVLRANSGAGQLDLPTPAPALGNPRAADPGALSPAEQAELLRLRQKLGRGG